MPYSDPDKYRAYQAQYRDANRSRLRANAVIYGAQHSDKKRAYDAIYRVMNCEKIRARDAAYRDAHRDEIYARNKKYAAEHPDVHRRAARKWFTNNPDKNIAYNNAKRARRANAPVSDFTVAQWIKIKDAYDHRCVYCNRHMQRLTQDHVVSLFNGGSHTASNIVPSCQSCNSRKGIGPPLPMQFWYAPNTECA